MLREIGTRAALAIAMLLLSTAARGQAPAPTPADSKLPPMAPLHLELPTPERLFRLESEAALQKRLRDEAAAAPRPFRVRFPEEPVLSTEPYVPRLFPPAVVWVAPAFLCGDPLGLVTLPFYMLPGPCGGYPFP